MSLVRRPVAAVLSLASTVLVGGVAWGLVSAHADGATPDAPVAANATAATSADTAAPATSSAPKVQAAATVTPIKPVPKPVTPRVVPPKPAPAKFTVPTTVTIQAISTTASEAQAYRAIFRGVLTATPKKQALTQQPVVLMVRVKGASAWTRAVTAVSSAPDGKLLVAVTQDAPSAQYKFVFDAKAPYKASSSAVVTVTRK